ncbi:ESPR-type extended signal peptide-containing protein [Negativicoccus succinicivorans]|uniref:ESPR-type extended signal peptide-containing protein n=1 Tax=Negativicoccus succinicivorans TaxID=620903 RepID=UPI002901B9DF|nr:ESPR-type extended signal peptide-containing protein [Negativicoccus succinicivorans]MDU2418221.1 ESPR-type extended signal peptide-containing protein [Negativicoccus succinicivorans]
MNKIYELVWSKVRNTWVVVSEIAKGHGKNSSSEKNGTILKSVILMALFGSFFTAGMPSVAALTTEEEDHIVNAIIQRMETEKKIPHYLSVSVSPYPKGANYNNDAASDSHSIAIGENASTNHDSIAIGYDAVVYNKKVLKEISGTQYYVTDTSYYNLGWWLEEVDKEKFSGEWGTNYTLGRHGVAIGTSSRANDTMAIAIGYKAQAGVRDSKNSVAPQIAIGTLAEASGLRSIALGTGATSRMYGGISIGGGAFNYGDGQYGIAIGQLSRTEKDGGIAMGYRARVQEKNGLALGNNTRVMGGDGSVALGYGSVADRTVYSLPYLASDDGVMSTMKEQQGPVSIGNSGDGEKSIARQIINLAAGTENSDAVNVAQLKVVNAKADKNATGITELNTKIDKGAVHYFSVNSDDSANPDGTNWNNDGATGKNAVAIGKNAVSTGKGSVAIGNGAKVDNGKRDGLAIGNGAESSNGSIVIGGGATDYIADSSEAGFGIYIGSDAKSLGGTNQTVLGNYGQANGEGATAIGSSANALDIASLAVGAGAEAMGTNTAAFGAYSSAKNENSTALGAYAHAFYKGLTTIGYMSSGNAEDGVALGSYSVANVAKGISGYLADGKTTETWQSTLGAVSVGGQREGSKLKETRQIINLAAGTEDSDAVNVAQLKVVNAKADKNATDITNLKKMVNTSGKATKVMVDGKENNTDGNLKITKTDTDGQLTYDLSLNDEITIGKAGEDGKDGKIGLTGKDGTSAEIRVGQGKAGADGKDGETTTRIIYKDKDGNDHEVATLDDGLKFKGDNDTVVTRKLNQQLNITGGAKAEDLSDDNIGVVGTAGDNGGMAVKLSKKLKGLTSAEFKDGDNVTNITGGNVTITRKEGNVDLWELNKTVNNITAGTTDVSSWKLQANGKDERIIKKDSVVNFKNGENTKVTVKGNDVTVDLNEATKKQINDNTTNIKNIDGRVTKIENSIDQKIEGAKVTVEGDKDTGVKVENTAEDGKPVNYKVSLDDKVKVGKVSIDGTGDKGEITGLTNTTIDAGDFATKGRAATEEQLKKAMAATQEASRTMVKAGDNITVTPATAGASEYTVSLKKDISVDSVTAKEYKVGDKTYINQDGINANGNKITNVADGTVSADSTDAVNGRQLYAVSQQIEKSAMGNVQKELSEMGDKVNEVQDESREGDAMNAALAALKPLDFDPYNRSQVMAGVSTYKGKQAVAVGLAHYSNEDTLVHAGIAYGGSSDLMANAGISWRFGDKDDRDARAKRAERLPQYADGPISSVYVMQDEMAELRAENQSLKEENKEIKRQVEMLMKHAGLNA